MFRTYIKLAWRNIWKNKIFSTINIMSLSIGLSASIVIGIIVYYDFTFDQFHPDIERIYRVTTKFSDPEGVNYSSGVSVPLVDDVDENFTGIEKSAFILAFRPYNLQVSKDDISFKEPTFVIYTDQNYFDIFSYDWLAGSNEQQLLKPNEVVLTASRATEYFPNKKPSQLIGETLIYDDSVNVTITGVVADFKQRTDLVFKEFVSLNTIKKADRNGPYQSVSWRNTNSGSQLLVKLEEDATVETFQKQLDQTAIAHENQEDITMGAKREFYAQPFLDIHFNQNYSGFDYTSVSADKSVMFMLGVIALFMLLLGCVNFINLNTAKSFQRFKEIGIRKTLGSSKKQLITQFLGETFLLTSIAAVFSIVLSVWLIDIFGEFIADDISINILADLRMLSFVAILIALVTLLAGFYPALVLSKLKPARILKGENKVDNGKVGLRKFLIVFQFTIAYVFIIATLLVGKQIHFLLNMDMGFKTDSIVYIDTPTNVDGVKSRELLAQKFQTIPQIDKISLGGGTPVRVNYKTVFKVDGKDGEQVADIDVVFGDSKFLDLYEIPLLAGRLPINDTIKEVVINKTALSKLGFNTPEEALNQIVNPTNFPLQITGVMDDFQNGSLKNEVSAMAFVGDIYRKYSSSFNTVHLSIKGGSANTMSTALTNVQNRFDEVYPDSNIAINFMDETVERFYKKERSMSKLLNWAMGLSVLISCMGLLGLVIYNTERRVKEIGIRKILGASILQINNLICKDFVVLIIIAFTIATPIAYWAINNWLKDFANRTEISLWVFAVSGFALIALSILIMSVKTIRTALKNPVNSLRLE
ncbi:MAG: ABC transporter permease [Psychroserpens sp.]|uniref:ABC transporter permease n=1 Tax=Psychroserpens sp. TaxID=2020870 RepID=UPI003C736C69